ncbi:methyltransferase type 11 [Streptomyces bingchenggensis BCW-1]|uniref:Methyltransferase type 11 n=1 Tax=Streptomyces bingchenggensis (strain BCW-1) TaxID=749414 RepID=D7BSJ5_STRBB|nr:MULTISPECIES: class I SAM-dependent methyltransferase [Streptomyces]ADI11492.1 methyltransferase type 11 [Streptomyces bingchenggensis BCW-1]
MTTEIANHEQYETWNGDEGRHWALSQPRYDAMLEPLTAPLLDAAALAPGDRVLDVGCGCGATTRAAAARAAGGEALGVDLSGPMLERATLLADDEGIRNARFLRADAQTYAFPPASHDALVSRLGMHVFADPPAAFGNLAAALRPGARLAFLSWQHPRNSEFARVPALALRGTEPSGEGQAFSLSDPARVRALLAGAGFTGVAVEAVEVSLRVGDTPLDAVEFMAGTGALRTALASADHPARERARHVLTEALEPYASPDGVRLGAALWLTTARRAG